MTKQEAIHFLQEHLKSMKYLESAMGVLSWDMEVMAPVKGIEYRSEVLGYLSV
ncbi:carboxypeptidase M32, partial [Turicibacter sanguinis]|nr:carboxypeptidase M32 [Turicibacter sanguinis]